MYFSFGRNDLISWSYTTETDCLYIIIRNFDLAYHIEISFQEGLNGITSRNKFIPLEMKRFLEVTPLRPRYEISVWHLPQWNFISRSQWYNFKKSVHFTRNEAISWSYTTETPIWNFGLAFTTMKFHFKVSVV